MSARREIDGMSGYISPIPFSEIESYIRLTRINGKKEQDEFIERIKFMDRVYCNAMNKKEKK